MKKCKGCGAILQDIDINKEGYTLSLDKDYCQRCFRLIHYGDTSKISKEKIVNELTVKEYKNYKNELFVLIIDAFDALNLDNDDLLDYYTDHKILIIINKIDLLPKNVKDDKMEDLFKNIINKCNTSNIVGCLLTYNKDPYFNTLFIDTLNELNVKKCVFVGRVNAGKTTIINKLLNTNDLTVSMYPGTTSSTNEIVFEGFKFIDTPGLIDNHSFINSLDKKLIKFLIPNKCVKPKLFQAYEPQTYFIEGLLSISVNPKRNVSLVFYIKNDLEIHRTKSSNKDSFIKKHINEYKLKYLPFTTNSFKVNKDTTLYIKGLGYIRIIGTTDVKIDIHDGIKVYKSKVKI